MVEKLMAVYLVVYFVLGLLAYHAMFDIWYFDLGRAIKKEIIGAAIFSLIMTALTITYWLPAMIIIIVIGMMLSGKCKNPTAKKAVIVVFIIVGISVAITGCKYNKQEESEQKKDELAWNSLLLTTSSDTDILDGNSYVRTDKA